MTILITEAALGEFRGGHLSSGALLDAVDENGIVVIAVPPGVGKSHSIDRILADPATFARYQLVICTAPTWTIIDERLEALAAGGAGGPGAAIKNLVLRPRPRALCGALDARWRECEEAGCTAHGKATLCTVCPMRGQCPWPDRLSEDRLRGVNLVYMAEQQLLANPGLIRLLRMRTGARRVLILLDEARFIDSSFVVALGRGSLARFRDAVAQTPGLDAHVRDRWLGSLERAIAGEDPGSGLAFPKALLRHAGAIQATGLQLHGTRFRFLGHQLADFRRSRAMDRWIDAEGALRFELLPDLPGDVLVLSAYLERDYVAHRLDAPNVTSPLADVRVMHTVTRIFNLKSRLGMETYFPGNSEQILDFFAAMIARNVAEGRTTTVVTRKKFVGLCTEGLTERLRALGVRFSPAPFDNLGPPDPRVVPVVTYGMLGINALADYDTCYCLNGFYVATPVLNEAVQGAVPEHLKTPLEVYTTAAGERRTRFADPAFRNESFLGVADACLRKLELEPALQAVARVRFNVRPREVWFFTTHDVQAAVGAPVREVASLAEAYRAAGVVRLRLAARAEAVERLRALMDGGKSLRKAAEELGLSRETASRWLRQAKCPKTPLLDLPGDEL